MLKRINKILSRLEDHPGILLYIIVTIPILLIAIFAPKKNQSLIGISILLTIWAIITVFVAVYCYKQNKQYKYWTNFHEKYGKPYVKISIPFHLWCDFDLHFYLYDENGDVKMGAKTEEEAIEKHNETGLYITRIIDHNRD